MTASMASMAASAMGARRGRKSPAMPHILQSLHGECGRPGQSGFVVDFDNGDQSPLAVGRPLSRRSQNRVGFPGGQSEPAVVAGEDNAAFVLCGGEGGMEKTGDFTRRYAVNPVVNDHGGVGESPVSGEGADASKPGESVMIRSEERRVGKE